MQATAIKIGMGITPSQGVGVPTPPDGYILLVDSDGYYLVDSDGYYLMELI